MTASRRQWPSDHSRMSLWPRRGDLPPTTEFLRSRGSRSGQRTELDLMGMGPDRLVGRTFSVPDLFASPLRPPVRLSRQNPTQSSQRGRSRMAGGEGARFANQGQKRSIASECANAGYADKAKLHVTLKSNYFGLMAAAICGAKSEAPSSDG